MMRKDSPTIRRRQLGVELRRLRDRAGMTGPQVAELLEWDPGKVYRLEGGKQGIKPKELRELLGHYGLFDEDEITEYLAMARDGKRPGWWSAYGPLSKSYQTYIGIETDATEIRSWEPIIINGLLQTPEYAKALIKGTSPDLVDDEVNRQVNLRLSRQARMRQTRMWMILDESVLYRIVGGSTVMHGQYKKLQALSRRPEMSIQVMPSAEGAHPGTRGQFSILSFGDGRSVYAETPAGEIYPEGRYAEACDIAFNQLLARALSPNQTRSIIEQAAQQI